MKPEECRELADELPPTSGIGAALRMDANRQERGDTSPVVFEYVRDDGRMMSAMDDEPMITRLARAAAKRDDEEKADRLLLALSREGFSLPFMARSANYDTPEALKAADDEAWQENRAALLRAVASAIPGATSG